MGQEADSNKLYQQVASKVAAAIRSGDYRRGRRLPSERELAEQFGVSRPTVREAMIALEIQGFVQSRHGSGVYVTDHTPKLGGDEDLDIGPFELTEARRVLEGETCALAAISITEAEVAELDAILLELDREAGGSGPGDRSDRRFHVMIAQATRNSALVTMVETLWDMRYRSPLCREMLSRARAAGDRPRLDEHRRIVQALAARDPHAARLAMRNHLTRVIDGLLVATEGEAVRKAREETAERRDAYLRRGSI
jgi:GntR family transcriptional repressor for pyruvate dehydrogenase complex